MELYVEYNTNVAEMNKSLPFAMPCIDMKKDGQTSLSCGSGEDAMRHAYEHYEVKPCDIKWGPVITKKFGKRAIDAAVRSVQRDIDSGKIKYEPPEARKARWQKEEEERKAARAKRILARIAQTK